jgi:hypothetical protein
MYLDLHEVHEVQVVWVRDFGRLHDFLDAYLLQRLAHFDAKDSLGWHSALPSERDI